MHKVRSPFKVTIYFFLPLLIGMNSSRKPFMGEEWSGRDRKRKRNRRQIIGYVVELRDDDIIGETSIWLCERLDEYVVVSLFVVSF